MSSKVLDVIFHIWIIWALFQLGRAKSEMEKLIRQLNVPPAALSLDAPAAES